MGVGVKTQLLHKGIIRFVLGSHAIQLDKEREAHVGNITNLLAQRFYRSQYWSITAVYLKAAEQCRFAHLMFCF